MSDLRQKLLGTWGIVRAELGSGQGAHSDVQLMPPEAAARIEIEFDDSGTYRVRFAGQVSDAGHFTLAAAADHFSENADNAPPPPPQQITLHGESGTNAGRTLPGILQLRGDRLKLCLALEGEAPPPAFTSHNSANGTPHYLVTYKRSPKHRAPH